MNSRHTSSKVQKCSLTAVRHSTMFRQLAATNPSVDWGELNSSLYTVTFMAQQNEKGKTCQYCLETDQQGPDCALVPKKAMALAPLHGSGSCPVSQGTEMRRGSNSSRGWPSGGMAMEPGQPAYIRSRRATRRGAYQGGQPPAKRACYT